jgi:branched-chain amino acid transport system ATP-binding protein
MGGSMSVTEPSLQVTHLTKRFGGVVAVNGVSFSIKRGEILGLIGPNGSGKSTVMKAIMGIERPDAGSVRIDGREVAGWPTHRIARLGVGMVFQHSRPLHRQTVLENIILGLLPDNLLRFRRDPAIEERARAIAERVGLAGALGRLPSTLPFADLRKIEIAKAMARDPQIVLIDEPFAGLTSRETAAFAKLIGELREDGRALLLVDHNVKSVSSLVDRVFAMYVGKRIAEGSADQVMRDETVRRVYLGGKLETAARPESSFSDLRTPYLQVENLSVFYDKAQALENVSIHVHQGEFVSVVGLNGAGKTTLFNAISGLLPYNGEIRCEGRSLRGRSPATIARAGIVQSPEGRELFTEMTVSENLAMGGQFVPAREKAARLDWLFGLFPVLKARHAQHAGTLSGGEQQMLTIARALMMKPALLSLDEPTLGLAPVILEQISTALERLRQTTPITVLLGEQNVTFALPHADRVYVLEHGRIVWEGGPGRFAAEAGTGYL